MRQGRGSRGAIQAGSPPIVWWGSSLWVCSLSVKQICRGWWHRKKAHVKGSVCCVAHSRCSKNISSLLPMQRGCMGVCALSRGNGDKWGLLQAVFENSGVGCTHRCVFRVPWECACNMYVMATNVLFEIYGWSWEKWGEVVVGDVGKLGAWGLCNPGNCQH